MVDSLSFGHWVSRRRKALDLTREELSKRVGCAAVTIKKIERDERRPSRQIAKLLAEALALPQEEHPQFILIARGERSVERLHSASDPVPALRKKFHNLPLQATWFVGREDELAKIGELLADPACRLLTITGAGGVGKSRVALRAAESQDGLHRDGIFLIPLARVESADGVASAIANSIGLELKGQVRSRLLGYLRDTKRELLLILDNFEHLLDASDLLTEILQGAPHVKLLVTSQERLNVSSEWVLQLDGLPYPTPESAENIEQYAAVELFVQIAGRVRTDFILGDADKPHVARICQLVEGMPLAIELAASWTRILSCHEIAHEIEEGIDILASSARDVSERHRSIRAIFDHAWRFLSEAERIVLPQLTIFRGGFTRESAEQVAGASLPVLSSLVDKSLLRLEAQTGVAQYYGFHELVRLYAHEQLLKQGPQDVNQVHARHLDYFLSLAIQAEIELTKQDNLTWFDGLDRNFDNLRIAFTWAFTNGEGRKAHLLVGTLWWFWCTRGHADVACRWAERSLALNSDAAAAAKITWVAGALNYYSGNPERGAELLEKAIALCRGLGSAGHRDLALALQYAGVAADAKGDVAGARSYWEESLELRRGLGDAWGISQSLFCLASVASRSGDHEKALRLIEEGLLMARESGERTRMIFGLFSMGWLAADRADYSKAQSCFHQCLLLCREMGTKYWTAETLASLLVHHVPYSEPGQFLKAARLWGAVEALHKSHGSSAYLDQDAVRQMDLVRAYLGDDTFLTCWHEGLSMTLHQAIDYAMEESAVHSS